VAISETTGINWELFLKEPITFSNRIGYFDKIKEYEIKMADKQITHSIKFDLDHGGLFMIDGVLYLGYINPLNKYLELIRECRKRMYFRKCTKKLIEELKENIRMYHLWREELLHPIVDYARHLTVPLTFESIIL